MILTTVVFACMDGVSRHLAANYSVLTVAAVRYWVFVAFVLATATARPGGIRAVARSGAPLLQVARGLLLAAELCVVVASFVLLGLIGTHAVFAAYPLLVAALAGPVLGEYVGWRRGVAILIGLAGVLVILHPGLEVVSPLALVPLGGAFLFALYALLTRKVGLTDRPETSLFYIAIVGGVAITLVAPFFWTPIRGWADWGWMLTLCALAILGHFLMIRAYAVAEAGTVQPFAYFQLVWVTIIAMTVFGETLDAWTVAGAALILGAGLYTILREARVGRR